jgi:hypothetical protein
MDRTKTINIAIDSLKALREVNRERSDIFRIALETCIVCAQTETINSLTEEIRAAYRQEVSR